MYSLLHRFFARTMFHFSPHTFLTLASTIIRCGRWIYILDAVRFLVTVAERIGSNSRSLRRPPYSYRNSKKLVHTFFATPTYDRRNDCMFNFLETFRRVRSFFSRRTWPGLAWHGLAQVDWNLTPTFFIAVQSFRVSFESAIIINIY